MATPTITLNRNEILLVQTTSSLGIVMDDNPFLFGEVVMINAVDDQNEVGQIVLFNPLESTTARFKYDGSTYFLVPTDKVRFTEIPPV